MIRIVSYEGQPAAQLLDRAAEVKRDVTQAVEAIVEGVRSLRRRCEHLVIVSNEVFSGGSSYAGDTLHYLHMLARVNRLLAQEADEVYEIVCGLPICHKGKGVGA